MNRTFALTVAAALLLLAGCSVQIGATHGGRVIVSAARAHHHVANHVALNQVSPSPNATRSLNHAVRPQHPRIAASRIARARDLSAANDVASMTFTLINTATNTVLDNENIDPGYPFIDLFLTPGGSYRIIIDVQIKAGAPGTNVGVTRYGDQADFVVDYNYDTYVDLSVHPTASLVFDPASVGGTPAKVKVYDPANLSTAGIDWSLAQSALTASANDKFFYGTDASLYYFNKTNNAIYSWKNIGSQSLQIPIDLVGDKVLDGVSLGTARGSAGTITLYSACADPWNPTDLWVIGYDTGDNFWYYYDVDISGSTPSTPNSPSVFDYNEISYAFVDESGEPADVTPTAIAVDSTWADVYISYYSHITTTNNVYSGLMQFYGGGIFASYPADYADFLISGAASSVITDVIWDQGKAWVLASPITAGLGTAAADTGIADLLTFDDYMNPLPTLNLSQVYNGAALAVSNTTTKLVIPNRFAGPVQGSKVYISQADFQNVATHVLSQVNLANTSVISK